MASYKNERMRVLEAGAEGAAGVGGRSRRTVEDEVIVSNPNK